MPPTPTATLSPIDQFSSSYDSASGTYNHYIYLRCWGVWYDAWSDKRLTDQFTEDKAVLYGFPIPSPPPSPLYVSSKYSKVHLGFKTNATIENQYLLIYHVKGRWGARAAFYINGNLVRSEEIDGEEYVAILVDCPPPQTFWHVCMYLEGGGLLEFKGIEFYIL
jgi:hypothetical protein